MTLAAEAPHASNLRVRRLTAAALTAALTAALGPFSITLGPVPFSIQTFGVALAAMLLPAGWAAGAMALYVALGAAGLPVFAKGAAGLGVLAGPTGGYLVGFILAAGLGALARTALGRSDMRELVADMLAGLTLIATIYAVGTAWLAFSLHLSLVAAITAGVAPFVVADVIKVGVAILIASAVRRAGVRL